MNFFRIWLLLAIAALQAQDLTITDPFDPENNLPLLMCFPTQTPADGASAAFQFNTVASPLIAVHPTNSKLIAIAMNQDPYNDVKGGDFKDMQFFKARFQEVAIALSSDGGSTFAAANVPLNVTLGGAISDGVAVSSLQYSQSGAHLFMAGRFNDMRPNILGRQNPLSGIWVCESDNSGRTWKSTIISTQSSDAAMGFQGTADGTPELAVDATDDEKATIFWERHGPASSNIFMSSTNDGGGHWSTPKQIYSGSCSGACALALDKSSLAASFMRRTSSGSDRVVLRSKDGGKSFDSSCTVVSPFVYAQEYNPSLRMPRLPTFPPLDGSERAHMALSSHSGKLYLLWQAGSLATKDAKQAVQHPEIVISCSSDNGKSWSKPMAVSQTYKALQKAKQDPLKTPAYQAFNGHLAYLADDMIGIIYYDHRNYQQGTGFAATDAWLAIFQEKKGSDHDSSHDSRHDPRLEFVTEHRLTPQSFNENLIQTDDYLFAGYGSNLGIAAASGNFLTAFCHVGTIVPADAYTCETANANTYCAHIDKSYRLVPSFMKISGKQS